MTDSPPPNLSPREAAKYGYKAILRKVRGEPHKARAALRYLCRNDLFFLFTEILGRKDGDRDWVFDRCREVQAHPDGYIDLWAREHFKSSIITFALTIQDILINPEETIGIASRTRPQAKDFLIQIKRELERNKQLKSLFPDILWQQPETEAPLWSADDGIIVKREGNPKESTLEAFGVVEGQPTGKHFGLLVYDDIIDKEAVTSEETIRAVTTAWELSLSLGRDGGRRRMVGTFYSHADTYHTVIARGAAMPRIKPATVDGEADGKPVLLSERYLRDKFHSTENYTFSCQYLLSPGKGGTRQFDEEWFQRWLPQSWGDFNIYVLVDPANQKKKKSDYTSVWVIGLGRDRNYYVIDGLRDKLELAERTNAVFNFVQEYSPLKVGYEEYGLMSDVGHIKSEQERRNFRFEIQPLGGNLTKADRIAWLIPPAKKRRIYLPYSIKKQNHEGRTYDVISEFIEHEVKQWPLATHDDQLDCMARIEDPNLAVEWPLTEGRGGRAGASGQANTDYDIHHH